MPINATILATLAINAAAPGAMTVDLSKYQLTATHMLPPIAASEASAVTYNWDTGTLFVIGDEGEAIVEVSTTGQQLSTMTLTGFEDTEGLTYMGGGTFAIAEERIQDLVELDYLAGGAIDFNNLETVSIGPTVGNIGLEGVSFDPTTGNFIMVKEKFPQRVMEADVDFSDESANVWDLFDPTLGLADLSDVQALSIVPGMKGGPDEQNLLIFSQESAMLLEVTRSGIIESSFDFNGIATDAEGVTIGYDGTIYIVGEVPALYVLQPIPAPASLALFACAGLTAAGRRR